MPPPPRSLDQVFRGMRDESSRASSEEAAAEQYRLALTYHEMGMPDDAIKALEGGGAVAAPAVRCGVDARPPVSRAQGCRPRDRVARTRRRSAGADAGCRPRACSTIWPRPWNRWASTARALAVFVELESESGGYRDVAGQIERLSKVAGSRLISVQAAPLRRPPARNRPAPGADPVVGVLGAQLFRRMARRSPARC